MSLLGVGEQLLATTYDGSMLLTLSFMAFRAKRRPFYVNTRNAAQFAVRNSYAELHIAPIISSSHSRDVRAGMGHQARCPHTLGCVKHCLGWVGRPPMPHHSWYTSICVCSHSGSNCSSNVIHRCGGVPLPWNE